MLVAIIGNLVSLHSWCQKGRGVGKREKRRGIGGERGRDACNKNPLLIISAAGGGHKIPTGEQIDSKLTRYLLVLQENLWPA